MGLDHQNTLSYCQIFKLGAYRTYLKIIWFLRRSFGIKAYGLGWVASKIRFPFLFKFEGVPFQFVPSASRSYCLLPAGIPNEPETHKFLQRILDERSNVMFVDVGASIGEFVITMSHNSHVSKILAFEPHIQSSNALLESARYAPPGKIEVIRKGVSSSSGLAVFDFSSRSPTAAGIRNATANTEGDFIQTCTLDEILKPEPGQQVVLLIDIEGGELHALQGGLNFIQGFYPLIVFEYNHITRQFFQLSDVMKLLGSSYTIMRLRPEDGRLDNDLSSTWNVVALPNKGVWANLSEVKELFIS